MIEKLIKNQVSADLEQFPAVAILGPRQVGKTTLAKSLCRNYQNTIYLDLERPSDLGKLHDAEYFLKANEDKLVCLDEIQLRPDLFPLLRSLIDEKRTPGRFLILGSSSPELLRQSAETLAGRIAYNYQNPVTRSEINQTEGTSKSWQDHLWRGGFPDSLLAKTNHQSFRWRESYIQTFLSRDLNQFGLNQTPESMRRLWTMCSHAHGQVINYSRFGQSLDQTHPTVKVHLDILVATFMARRLLPYEINTKKRLVKSPKVYLRDSGILCSLLDLDSFEKLYSHPSYGSAWEGFAIENIIAELDPKGIYGFFRTHTGEEIDLVMDYGGKKIGIEFKTSSSPVLSKENRTAQELLQLDELYVVTPQAEDYPIKDAMVTSLDSFLAKMST